MLVVSAWIELTCIKPSGKKPQEAAKIRKKAAERQTDFLLGAILIQVKWIVRSEAYDGLHRILSPGGTMLNKILLATDGSELSKRAVLAAVNFAASYGSRIVGLAVSEIFPNLVMPALGAGYDLKGIEEETFAQSKLNADYIADCAKKAGADYEVHTVKGTHAHEEILRFATEFGCDSIFMASHGRKGLDKLILGSETQKVLTYSKLPVLVFK